MKHKLQTMLKHKLQWLLLLAALLGVSQGVWGDAYSASTPVYVRALTSKSYTTVALHVWGGTASTTWPGQTMTYMGSKDSYDYWTYTFTGSFTNMIVTDGNNTKYSGDDNGNVISGNNCITVTGSGYSWSSESISWCDFVSVPLNVLNGKNVMFYFRTYSWGNDKTGITNGNTTLIGTTTKINDTDGYVTMAASSVPTTVYVTNNADPGNWGGQSCGSSQTSANAAGAFYKGNANPGTKTNATTLSTFSASSTSITEGTSSITLTVRGSSANSSYGDPLWAIIYVDSTKDGCMSVKTTNQSYTLGTSSLEPDTYTIKAVLTDGRIYYLSSSTITLTVTSNCTYPSAPTTISASPAAVCDGSSSTITTGTATAGYTYKLYNGSSFVGDPIVLAADGTLNFGSITPDDETTYTVYAIETGSECEYTQVGSASVTVSVNSLPTITLDGDGPKSGMATYPWEWFTVTAETSESSVDWSKEFVSYTGASSEPDNSVETTATTYKLKSAITANDGDKYTITGTVTDDNGCVNSYEYDFYINAADAETCN